MASQASILVVDDNQVHRSTLNKMIGREGHRVTTAEDGRRAVELLRAEPFDVVVLDIMMPEMDGFAVLEEMKADPELRHLPVVVITALDDLASAVRCIEMGADDYLTKPFHAVVLRARINAGLSKKRLRDLERRHMEEMARLNQRLEARVEEQMAELVRTGQLRRFLPTQVAEALLAGQLGPAQPLERRRVTILFADMVGFTDLSDSLEPEELADVLDEYLREMSGILVAHGGTLDNYIGDGIMAMFGAPQRVDDQDQALSAVRAALAMRSRTRELAAGIRARGTPADLQIRVGINAGHCTVGVFGGDVLRAYKVVGFAVNVAARLQTEAAPGCILCGYRTYALVRDLVRAVERSPFTIKGAARPVEAWEILDLEEAPSSDPSPEEPLSSPGG